MDFEANTALHLDAAYTPDQSALDKLGWTRIDYYANWIIKKAKKLPQSVDTLCVDGYFAKKKFINAIFEKTNLSVISKMRTDANLRYLYNGEQKKGPGRKKVFGEKINLKKQIKES